MLFFAYRYIIFDGSYILQSFSIDNNSCKNLKYDLSNEDFNSLQENQFTDLNLCFNILIPYYDNRQEQLNGPEKEKKFFKAIRIFVTIVIAFICVMFFFHYMQHRARYI